MVPARLLLVAMGAALGGCAREETPELVPAPLPGELDPELSAAVQAARATVLAAPEEPQRWLELGMTYEGGDLFAQARTCYERSLARANNERAAYRLSIVCAKLGDGAAAVAAIQRALAVQPGYAPAHWRRGTYLYDQGDFDQALAAYQEAARLDPSFIGAWTGIARILLQRGEAPKAVELLERLRGESPEHAHVLSLLQAAYVQAGRPEDAAAVPTVWMASASPGQDPWQGDFRPYRARPLIERARERLERGRAQEALELLEPFVTAGSEDWNAHAYLARAHGVLGHASQARAIVDKALARDPDNVLLLNELALLLESTGERGAALATFERILALDPHHPEAARARARLAGAGG